MYPIRSAFAVTDISRLSCYLIIVRTIGPHEADTKNAKWDSYNNNGRCNAQTECLISKKTNFLLQAAMNFHRSSFRIDTIQALDLPNRSPSQFYSFGHSLRAGTDGTSYHGDKLHSMVKRVTVYFYWQIERGISFMFFV